jgi:hypothetical protein
MRMSFWSGQHLHLGLQPVQHGAGLPGLLQAGVGALRPLLEALQGLAAAAVHELVEPGLGLEVVLGELLQPLAEGPVQLGEACGEGLLPALALAHLLLQ